MGKTFTIISVQGFYRAAFDFVADSLNEPGAIPAGHEEFTRFLSSIAVHNGVEMLVNRSFGIEVQVVCSDGELFDDMLLVVNNVFEWEVYEFQPLVLDKEGLIQDRYMTIDASSFIIAHGNKMFETYLSECEEAGLTGLDFLVDLSALLVNDRMPWYGCLHVRSLPIIDEDGPEHGRSPISAFAWRFMDGSLAFLTEKGLKTEDQFQMYCIEELKVPFIDGDFNVLTPSASVH